MIKYYPPKPKKRSYSSFFLLKNIVNKNVTKKKFPLWLLIFRLLICFLIIFFFSDPYFKKEEKTTDYDNYIIISDNAWSKASNWQNYKNIVKEMDVITPKDLVDKVTSALNWGIPKLRDDITCMAINFDNPNEIEKKKKRPTPQKEEKKE